MHPNSMEPQNIFSGYVYDIRPFLSPAVTFSAYLNLHLDLLDCCAIDVYA